MWREKFDTVIEYNKREYRYNSKECVLEWVSTTDYIITESDDLETVNLEEPMVVDSIGLTKENAEADLMGYIHGWDSDIQEELEHEMKFL